MKRNLIGGLAVGLAATLLIHLLHFVGLIRTAPGANLLKLVLVVHGLVLVWAFRGHVKAGQGRFAQLLGAGMLISLLAGIVGGAGFLLYTEVTDPSYLEWLREESMIRLQASPLSAAEKERLLPQIEESLQQPRYALQTIQGSMFSGLLGSLILGILLRDRNPA